VGVIYERYHTREMSEMSGLWKRLPLFAFFLILASLGSAAVPGLNGFVGEFPILTGMFARDPRAAVLSATGMILGAYYLLWMLQCVLFGPLREPSDHGHGHDHGHDHGHGHGGGSVRPMGWHEIAGLTPLMVLIVAIGVYPKPFFDRIRPTVAVIASRFPAPERPASTVAGGADVHASPAARDGGGRPAVTVAGAATLPACCDPASALTLARFRKRPLAGAGIGGGVDSPRNHEEHKASEDQKGKDGGQGRQGLPGKGRS
jgi:hypothetical protein